MELGKTIILFVAGVAIVDSLQQSSCMQNYFFHILKGEILTSFRNIKSIIFINAEKTVESHWSQLIKDDLYIGSFSTHFNNQSEILEVIKEASADSLLPDNSLIYIEYNQEEENSLQSLMQAVVENELLKSFTWFLDEIVAEKVVDILDLRLDSLVFTFECSDHIIINEIYKVKKIHTFKNHLISLNYSNDATENSTPISYIWWRRANLTNVTLINTVETWDNYLKLTDSGYDGFFVDIVDIFRSMMNFDMEWINPPDRNWGTLENGTWTGMVGQLSRGEADLSTTGLTLTLQRLDACDFSKGTSKDLITLISGISSGVNINFYAYLLIFDHYVWISIFVMTLLIAVLYLLMEKYAETSRSLTILADSYAKFLLNLIQIDQDNLTKRKISSKILFVNFSCTFSFVLFAYYNGVLTSLMTTTPAPIAIESFKAVWENNYFVTVWQGSASLQDMENASPGSYMDKVWSRVLESGEKYTMTSNDEVVRAIRSEPNRVLFYGAASTFYKYPDLTALDIKEKKRILNGIGLAKNSEFKSLIDFHLGLLEESGVLAKLTNKWLENGKMDPLPNANNDMASASVLGYDNILFPFLILVGGIALSLALSLMEFLQVKNCIKK